MTQQEVIQKFITTLSNSKAITGSAAVNEAFNEASGKRFSTMQEAIDAFLRDCKAAKNTDDFLRNYCGIILDNEDNGSITGLDAGGIKLKTDETIVLETSEVKKLDTQYLNKWDKWTAGEEVPLDNGNATVDKSGTLYFEKLGLTVKVPDYDKIIEAANDSDKAKSAEAQRKLIVVNGLYSWWIEGALQLIKDSYGDEFSFENNKKTITLELENNGNNGTSAAVNAVNTLGLFTLKINMYYLSTINSEDHDGKLTNQKGEFLNEYLDGLLAHELTHGVMASKFGLLGGDIKWFLLPKVIVEGTAELTRGVDIIREDTISESIEEQRKNNYLTDILDYDSFYENAFIAHPIKVTFDKDDADSRNLAKYASGYMLLRYLAKQCADKPITGGIRYATLPSNVEYIVTTEGNSTTNLGEKTTTIVKTENGKFSATVIGSAVIKQDEIRVHKNPLNIEGSAHDFSIIGGDGDDYVSLQSDNISINSGWGKDTIIVEGNDARISTAYERNEKTSMAGGNKLITIIGNSAKVSTGGGSDNFVIRGNQNEIINERDSGLINDNYTISAGALNNTIHNFEEPNFDSPSHDELWFESGEITAEIQTLNGTKSVVISSAKTGDTLVVLAGVTNGSKNNIVYHKDDGGTMTTSIDWLLANTTPVSPNPDDTVNHRIDVPVDGNVNNTRDDVIINAVSGDNVIQNSGNNVIITGGTDKDEVSNNANNVTVDGKAGNDVLSNGSAGSFPITHVRDSFNGGDSVILNGGVGADLICNYLGVNVELRGGEDNDTINNTGNNVQITGDNGNDAINNNGGDMVTIDGGDGKDTLFSSGKSVSIFGGNGEDSIRINASGANATVNGGNDDDNISNYGSNALIDGGSGDDSIDNWGSNVTIDAGAGADSIVTSGNNLIFNGGDGDDSIRNYNSNSTIDGGDGNDFINNSGNNVTIDGNAGNDTIYNSGNYVNINGGAGNDSIRNEGDNALIVGNAGNNSIRNEGDNALIVGSASNDYIHNFHGNNATINSGTGSDSIFNYGDSVFFNTGVLINTGEDDDFIFNDYSINTTINSGTGNDFIRIHNGFGSQSDVSINAGDGNDTIDNNSWNVTIEAGDGADLIDNNSGNVTINSGKDDDTIHAGNVNNLIIYNSGDGNDIITGFNTTSTLSISGAEYSSLESGNDVIIGIGNDKITLVGAANLPKFNIIGIYNGQKPADTTPADTTPADTTPADTTPADTTPADTTPADTTPADTTPADTTPADTTPADTTPADTTPADTTPADTTPADTTPADTTPADTTPSGQDQVVPVQIIRNLTGIDINHLEKVIVTDTDSLDDIIAERTVWLNFSTDSSKGVQNVDLSKSPYRQVVSLEGGNQKVQFNDENGNVAIVDASATGSKNIIFGNGDDLGIFYSSDANIRATVGSGRDSIITDNNAHVRVDMTNSEGTKIIPYSGRIILDNYDPDSRAEIIIPDVTDITSAIKDNSIQLIGNEVRPNSSTRIQLNDSTNANIVNLSTEHGDTQKVGFTGINGGAVDAHELRGNFLLKGNYAENASDKQKRKPSTLISGNGHDTILAGARDFVDGGNGRNQIFLTPYDLRQIRDGATIAFSGNGRNTIHGFHEGFGYDGDVIQVKDFNKLKFKFDTDGLLLTANDSRIKFDGIGITSVTTDDSTNSLGTNRAELIQITNGSSTMRTAVAQTNQSILVQEDDYITPNAFFGNRSGLNFSEYSGSVEINLTDGTGKLGKWDATFKGINKLQAGNGMSTLIGDDTRNTLIAGTGYTSMWGGAGNDKLIGKGNSTDKDGRTTFFFFAGDGRDVISDFTFLTPENRYDGIDDRINVGNSDINNAYRAGNNVVVVFDQNSYLILEDAVGKDFQIANMIAKVDRNIAYDGLANCYVASGGSSLTVDSTVRSAEIWLDNSHGTQFFGNIRTLDASAVEGNTSLVGNEFDDTIIAGQGDSSLWGGFSPSNDLLIGGSSRNTFFYCMGNGNDTIQGINDKDSIILSDVSLDQIIETSITADSVSIRFNDGGSLQIQGTSDVTYQLADGSRYSANHEHLEWDSR